jgi:hypothetical protein
MIGIEDDGTFRYLDAAAGSSGPGHHPDQAAALMSTLQPGAVVYELIVHWRTLDLMRLLSGLADTAAYRGSWLLGIDLISLAGRYSSLIPGAPTGGYDHDGYHATTRATTSELATNPTDVTERFLRHLFRDLDSEQHIPGHVASNG